ncbi:MAG: DUF3035 domain-containing protein [Alphaproteobacteria bacterium]|nr:DUF3035 domain-containing protein [Alphaproteobacteria bacterium]
MDRKFSFLVTAAVCTVLLSGCSGVKKQLGLEKSAPDEFMVIKHAPLAMPPGMALPPPTPGAPRPQEQAPIVQAEQAVFGTEASVKEVHEKSSGEDAFLRQAGAAQTDPSIRATIDRETEELNQRNKPVSEKLLGIGGKTYVPPASVVDPKAEVERLKKNKEEGKPVTEGETPSVEE